MDVLKAFRAHADEWGGVFRDSAANCIHKLQTLVRLSLQFLWSQGAERIRRSQNVCLGRWSRRLDKVGRAKLLFSILKTVFTVILSEDLVVHLCRALVLHIVHQLHEVCRNFVFNLSSKALFSQHRHRLDWMNVWDFIVLWPKSPQSMTVPRVERGIKTSAHSRGEIWGNWVHTYACIIAARFWVSFLWTACCVVFLVKQLTML